MNHLQKNIEALIFASEQSISLEEIGKVIFAYQGLEVSEPDLIKILEDIKAKYQAEDYIIELKQLAGGFQFLTKKDYFPIINQLQIQRYKKKLSQAALETLAIIAYRQPITKLEIEQVRGVNCDYSVQKLLERELISVVGKSDTVGHPILYGTSALFSDYFGINNINDLPQLKDLTQDNIGSSIGETQE